MDRKQQIAWLKCFLARWEYCEGYGTPSEQYTLCDEYSDFILKNDFLAWATSAKKLLAKLKRLEKRNNNQ